MTRDLLVLGEALAAFVPGDGESFRRSAVVRRFTVGAEVNVAVAVARAGLQSAWLGRIGSDLQGFAVLDDLRREGVDTSRVITEDSAFTGVLVRETSTLGGASVSYARSGSAGAQLRPSDVDASALTGFRMAHVSGVTAALNQNSRATARAFLQTAQECGVRTSFDLNFRSKLWSADEAAPVLAELAGMADIVIGGRSEWDLVFATQNLADVHLPNAQLLIQTAGPDEIKAKEGTVTLCQGVVPAPVRDVVGAGDAFVGGVLAGLLAGLSTQEALRQGAYCGARVVGEVGDWTGLPWGSAGQINIPRDAEEVRR